MGKNAKNFRDDERGSFVAEAVLVCLALVSIFLGLSYYGTRMLTMQRTSYQVHTLARFTAARLPPADVDVTKEEIRYFELQENLLYVRVTKRPPEIRAKFVSVPYPPLEGL